MLSIDDGARRRPRGLYKFKIHSGIAEWRKAAESAGQAWKRGGRAGGKGVRALLENVICHWKFDAVHRTRGARALVKKRAAEGGRARAGVAVLL